MRVPVKVCGITRLDDALAAADLGAWALGFIFYPKSPRYIEPRRAAAIISKLPPEILTVGVFVNEPRESIERARSESGVSRVQLHGEESIDLCAALGEGVIKAFRLKEQADVERASAYSPHAMLLADAAVDGQYGGTGRLASWDLARALAQKGTLLLSGGLTAANVLSGIEQVAPWGVDVSSGVEREPGIKDLPKMKAFFEALSVNP